MKRLIGDRFDGLWFTLAVLAVWQLLSWRIGSEDLASPYQSLHQIAVLFASHGFWTNVAATGQAFGIAVVIAVLLGAAIGLTLGLFPFAGEVADPIVNALASLPKITLYPIILLFFGLGLSAKVAFGTIHGIFPVIILTANGVRSIRPVIRKAARSLRLSPWDTVRTVLLPAALPEVFTGVRLGVALTLLGTLIGEMFASDRGIGFMLIQDVQHQDSASIMALTLLLLIVAVGSGIGLLAIDKRLHGTQ